MNFEDLKKSEFQEKLKNAESAAELVNIAKEEGIELSDEQLDQVNGGGLWSHPANCPVCGNENIYHYGSRYYCRDCGHEWDDGGW